MRACASVRVRVYWLLCVACARVHAWGVWRRTDMCARTCCVCARMRGVRGGVHKYVCARVLRVRVCMRGERGGVHICVRTCV